MFVKSMIAKQIAKTDTKCRSLLAAACLLLLPCAAFAQTLQPPSSPSAITMQQAVDLARAKNPTLLAAQQNLLSVKAQEIQAGVRANPYFTLYGTNVTLPAEGASNPYSYSGQVSRLFERGQKRRWRLDVARSTTVQTDAQLQLTIQQTVLAVHQAFTNFVIAKAAKKLADDNLADYRHELQISHDRYAAGDIAKLDFERLDLQLAQFETDESNAITAAQQASDQLQVLLGTDKPRTDFDVIGDVVPPPLAFTMEELEQKALAARPDLKAATAAVAVADASVKLAYANGTTDPTLEGEYDRSGTYNSAGFSINIPIRLFDRNQGNKETAKFTAQASRFSVTAAHNQVISDVDQAYSGYFNAKVLSDRYNGHYLDEAKDVLDIAQFSYQHGGLALIDYLDALRESRSVTADALNAYSQTWMAIHQLSFATATEMIP
ncbi:TolC family protein [Tunturiibacter empetritectus]|uniref:Cobalt-zinc-cadmium efflux system outer membrane protein n=1 Tax=Tunturiibacter lichenicola TaxID=2051959 RepID=A0A852VC78_9BACT|nr:TolC family protein [Edaphobacter lichenicola]NYF90483.1 cobalt-zinc-cadmium efflux system outer membrane protein [Edaphobacter lichenicola]